MVILVDAKSYSIQDGIAYEITYSEGTIVRAITQTDGFIRNEYLLNGTWKLSGKPYIVIKNNKRQGNRIIEEVKKFLLNV